jgi:hypothetical protein
VNTITLNGTVRSNKDEQTKKIIREIEAILVLHIKLILLVEELNLIRIENLNNTLDQINWN